GSLEVINKIEGMMAGSLHKRNMPPMAIIFPELRD
ncbi:MAG TPA: NAD(+) synthetase, partial [Syntrophomonas wolfei]|nr:NAD(+) synthetase [Syntrophomonas wolfei]